MAISQPTLCANAQDFTAGLTSLSICDNVFYIGQAPCLGSKMLLSDVGVKWIGLFCDS